ncbi:hypothetical protein D3C86_1751420 [compost metagenome]
MDEAVFVQRLLNVSLTLKHLAHSHNFDELIAQFKDGSPTFPRTGHPLLLTLHRFFSDLTGFFSQLA